MSDLVEKVASTMWNTSDPSSWEKEMAEKAIVAVLEHYSEAGNMTDEMFRTFCTTWDAVGGTVGHSFAAAIRAERQRMVGKKPPPQVELEEISDEAAAPRPDTACEWTLIEAIEGIDCYRTSHGQTSRFKSLYGKCIDCGKPIKFL